MTDGGMPSPDGHIHYDGRRFSPVVAHAGEDHAGGGELPVAIYHHTGDLVWAEFSGGSVRIGRLVGSCRPDGTIDATYCMVTTSQETIAGGCVSTPTVLPDGRVRLREHWRRLDGSSGVSQIEEIGIGETSAERRSED